MKYLLLIYEDEALYEGPDVDISGVLAAYNAYTDALRAAGVLVASEALTPVRTATTVRVRGGKATTTDGPFAETKEQLGGFYLIDVPTLDEALAWAAKLPGAETGSIEVRPIMDWSSVE